MRMGMRAVSITAGLALSSLVIWAAEAILPPSEAPAGRIERSLAGGRRQPLALGLLLTGSQAYAQTASTSRGLSTTPIGDHEILIETLTGRLDLLEARLTTLQDQVGLLQETALGAEISETRARIVHKNELGESFVLERARYLLDGGILLDRVDQAGALSAAEELVLFDGPISSGNHVLEVEVICRGGGFGLFSYVEAYRFKITSKYVFKVREGRFNELGIVLFQKADITVEPQQRLGLRYDVDVTTPRRTDGDGAP